MANTITTNPLILNTTATIAFTRPILVKRIEWYKPQSVGDTFSITDLAGNVLNEGTCEVALQSQITWSGPQKLTLPGKASGLGTVGNPNGSWVFNETAATTASNVLVWF